LSEFKVKHDVSDADSAPFFIAITNLLCWTHYRELFTVIDHHTTINLLRYEPENRSSRLAVTGKL
jgi:hypothetical protein